MKIEITLNKPAPEQLKLFGVGVFVLASALVLLWMGFATWLLLMAFTLILVAIGLLWSSVTMLEDEGEMSLEEALDLAAPARDEERKLAVLRGLKDLEYERGLGKISDQDYQDLSRRYRKEAKRLLERLDTSESHLRERAMDLVRERLNQKVGRDSSSSQETTPAVRTSGEPSSKSQSSEKGTDR